MCTLTALAVGQTATVLTLSFPSAALPFGLREGVSLTKLCRQGKYSLYYFNGVTFPLSTHTSDQITVVASPPLPSKKEFTFSYADEPFPSDCAPLTVALAGNPNCGKTSLLNFLCHTRERVGNYEGVTLYERSHPMHAHPAVTVTDLPGAFALTPSATEKGVLYERLHQADCVINLIDATSLPRSLALTVQLLGEGVPVVVGLNFCSQLKDRGGWIDIAALSARLGVPVLPVCAKTGKGCLSLLAAAVRRASSPTPKREYDPLFEAQKIASGIYVPPRPCVRLDKIVLHPVLGAILFLVVLCGVFALTFGLGGRAQSALQAWLSYLVTAWGQGLSACCRPTTVALVTQGCLGGITSLIGFLPVLSVLFFCLGWLEESGYLSRVTVLAQPLAQKTGLSGSAVLPLLLGFGCTVSALSSTKLLSSKRERRRVALLSPLVCCSAKLPTLTFLSLTLFPSCPMLALAALVLFPLLLILPFCIGAPKPPPTVTELPSWQLPSMKVLLSKVWVRTTEFLVRTVTLVFFSSLLIWFLQYFTPNLQPATELGESVLGMLCGTIAPLFLPTGITDPRLLCALACGLLAKESTLSVLGVMGVTALPLSCAMPFAVFFALYPPCIAATSTLFGVTGKRRGVLCYLGYFALAYAAATLCRLSLFWV